MDKSLEPDKATSSRLVDVELIFDGFTTSGGFARIVWLYVSKRRIISQDVVHYGATSRVLEGNGCTYLLRAHLSMLNWNS
jgi:hypothetical protein